MKKNLISTIAIVLVLAIAFVAVGAEQGGATRISQARSGFMNPEQQLKALTAIEEQVKTLKAAMQNQPSSDQRGNFQNMSDEERAKFRETFTKAYQARQAAINTIMAQLAMLQGRTQPLAEGESYVLVSTVQLKTIQELATKEKATETATAITSMIQRGARAFFFGGNRQRTQRTTGED